MTFYVFYSNFSVHDSLEYAVSGQLEWLKYQKIFGDLPPDPHKEGLTANANAPDVLRTLYGIVKIRCP